MNALKLRGPSGQTRKVTWSIEISDSIRSIEVTTGQTTRLLTEETGLSCIAIAPMKAPLKLVLIFDSQRGLTFKGRKPLCPVVVANFTGGEVSITRAGKRLGLKVSTLSKSGICCLCHLEYGDERPSWLCPKCGAGFHVECVRDQGSCPVCRTIITERRKRQEV